MIFLKLANLEESKSQINKNQIEKKTRDLTYFNTIINASNLYFKIQKLNIAQVQSVFA